MKWTLWKVIFDFWRGRKGFGPVVVVLMFEMEGFGKEDWFDFWVSYGLESIVHEEFRWEGGWREWDLENGSAVFIKIFIIFWCIRSIVCGKNFWDKIQLKSLFGILTKLIFVFEMFDWKKLIQKEMRRRPQNLSFHS